MQNLSSSTEWVQVVTTLDRPPKLPPDEANLALSAGANLLLIGTDRSVVKVINALQLDFAAGVVTWLGGRLVLPHVGMAATLIIRNVGSLTLGDQGRLFEWLSDAPGRVQVISTSHASLVPLVEAGAFLDRLYYRLNMVCVDLTA